jgi:hypothetical protein
MITRNTMLINLDIAISSTIGQFSNAHKISKVEIAGVLSAIEHRLLSGGLLEPDNSGIYNPEKECTPH